MLRKLKYAVAALLLATPAYAAVNVTIVPSAFGVQGGGTGFETAPVGALVSPYNEAGLTFSTVSGSVQVKVPPSDSNGAFPAGNTSSQYLSVLGGGAVDISAGSERNRLQLYWGSIDTYNAINFYNNNVVVASLSGADVLPFLIPNGNQVSALSNRLVTIYLNSGTYDFARLTSSSNSFEIDNISAAVPEPSTWAMMLFGFGALGLLSSRRSRRLTPVSA